MGCGASKQPGGKAATIKKIYEDPDPDAVATPQTPPQFAILGVGEVADQVEAADPAFDTKNKRPSVTFVRNPCAAGNDADVSAAPVSHTPPAPPGAGPASLCVPPRSPCCCTRPTVGFQGADPDVFDDFVEEEDDDG